ncbi:head-tail adaptor protein [Belliella sp. DSM 107340]|uniref:Head-tail adaptor protein n=1 Tax=Belliella calami TaxID=2923436 RepID=A0ABS9UK06_9BACT|nr:head-tail adaptor protein [Belliella calami]MCH7396563.1 head-tail adaptor protein [Belliella calami]
MYIGNFNRYISFYENVTTKNSYNEPVSTFTKVYECDAEKYDKVNTERFEANQNIVSEITFFTIHFPDFEIDNTYLILDEDSNKVYEIKGIKEIGYEEGLQLITQHKSRFKLYE